MEDPLCKKLDFICINEIIPGFQADFNIFTTATIISLTAVGFFVLSMIFFIRRLKVKYDDVERVNAMHAAAIQ
jgi:hypothetical protein